MKKIILFLSIAAVVLLSINTAFSTLQYSITDLGTFPGGDWSVAFSVNDYNQVTGWGRVGYSYNYPHAFFWQSDVMQDLGTFGGDQSYGYDINNLGQVVGLVDINIGGPWHAWWRVQRCFCNQPLRAGWAFVFSIDSKKVQK